MNQPYCDFGHIQLTYNWIILVVLYQLVPEKNYNAKLNLEVDLVAGRISNTERAIIGSLGGLAAICVKYVGQDHNFVTKLIQSGDLHDMDLVLALFVGYAILTPMLMFLGALIAWGSSERNRLKLLALGVAAPALITTWAGGTKSYQPSTATTEFRSTLTESSRNFNLFPIAHAADKEDKIDSQKNGEIEETKSDKSAIIQGIELFFGYGKEPQKYWVVVGSYIDRAEAEVHAERINKEEPSLRAFVGNSRPGNKYLPVIVGGYLPLDEARAIMRKARALDSVDDAFLSAYSGAGP